MKKNVMMLIASCLLLIGLTACSNDKEDSTNNLAADNNQNEQVDVQDNAENENNADVDENESQSSEDESNATNDNPDNELADFEEMDTVNDHIDIDGLSVNIEVDSNEKRIILFENNHKPAYKTIYIKQKNRLKIIDIKNDNGEIYDEEI